jgi:hypothetical protein
VHALELDKGWAPPPGKGTYVFWIIFIDHRQPKASGASVSMEDAPAWLRGLISVPAAAPPRMPKKFLLPISTATPPGNNKEFFRLSAKMMPVLSIY